MINQDIITVNEHEIFWKHQVETQKYRFFKVEEKQEILSIITFFRFAGKTCFWGFYLTAAGMQNKWSNWINSELGAIHIAKDVLDMEILYCETLRSNQVVLNLHKRSGFAESVDQTSEGCVLMEKLL